MFSYKPLAELLKNRKLKLNEVCEEAGVNGNIMTCKMNSGEYVSMEYLDKLCETLQCDIGDIVKWQKGNQSSSEKVNVNWDSVVEKLEENSLSMNELSEKCRLSKSALGNAKLRNSQVRKWTVESMARILKCSVEDLI